MLLNCFKQLQKNNLNSRGFGVSRNQDSSATTSRPPPSRTWNETRGLANLISVALSFLLSDSCISMKIGKNVLADSYGNELNISRGDCFQSTVAREPGFILGDSTQYQV